MKKKCTVWVEEDVWSKLQNKYREYNFNSISELTEKALEFYLSYRTSKEIENYLAEGVIQAVRSTVKLSEDRLARILYKLAVEDAMMKEILAAAARVNPDALDKVRRHCVDELKTMSGILDLKRAAKRQEEEEMWE